MPLLGQGAMMFWHDISGDDDDYNHWHVFEHMPERVGIPGFHRGRRYLALDGGPAYFNMYETSNPDVLISEPYLQRLNNPSAWSTRSLPKFRNSNRSLCRVVASAGRGLGGALLTLQYAPKQGESSALARSLSAIVNDVVTRPGIVAAHLLETDDAASRLETAEKALRDVADEVADWVLLVEGLNGDVLARLRESDLAEPALLAMGVAEIQNVATYQLLHVLPETEL